MKVSVHIVEKLIGFTLPPAEALVERINAQLGGVEEIVALERKYKDAKIVRIVECKKHPNADKLSICRVDAGTGELVQVVCGAPNVHADMWAVWLPPESVVPSTFDDDEPFVLGARELRGVLSQGMLAAGDELAINSDHDGIVEITEYDLPEDAERIAGASFAKTFGLDDTIIDIENKMFTHRPDLFGQVGVAREIAGIFGKPFTSPAWYQQVQDVMGGDGLGLTVFNDAPEKAPRFMAIALKDVVIKPSPLWLQIELVRMGGKPINNIVDATNYVMLMTAQPTHAYDYDKLRGQTLGVRMAKKGESVELLNDKTYQLDESDIVIVDGEGPVGLAGIMGGSGTEVDKNTTRIVLECATFDMYTVRKSSMRHGLFTDALTRFNKGQSPLQNSVVLGYLLGMIDGRLASEVFDRLSDTVNDCVLEDRMHRADSMGITAAFISERLGLELAEETVKRLLENVEFKIDIDEKGLSIHEPFWRMDIENPEDIVEEVGRLYGFDKLPRELPRRSTEPAPKNPLREVKERIRQSLKNAGANEVLTYSFVHEQVLQNAGQDKSQAFKLSNALSPDLQYYRLSVLPSLLDKVHANIKAGHGEFVLFEIGKGHNKKYHLDDDEGLPKELQFVDAVYASKKPGDGAPFYHVRSLVEQLAKDLRLRLIYKPVEETFDFPVTAPFDLSRSALLETTDGIFVGMVGELKQQVMKKFKLPDYVAAITLDLEGLAQATASARQTYRPLSRFPSISQDISLKVGSEVSYRALHEAITTVLREESELDIQLAPVSVYQPEHDTTTKTVTFRLTCTHHNKTLSDGDVAPIVQAVGDATHRVCGAVVA